MLLLLHVISCHARPACPPPSVIPPPVYRSQMTLLCPPTTDASSSCPMAATHPAAITVAALREVATQTGPGPAHHQPHKLPAASVITNGERPSNPQHWSSSSLRLSLLLFLPGNLVLDTPFSMLPGSVSAALSLQTQKQTP